MLHFLKKLRSKGKGNYLDLLPTHSYFLAVASDKHMRLLTCLYGNCWRSKFNCLNFIFADVGTKSCVNANKTDTNRVSTKTRN